MNNTRNSDINKKAMIEALEKSLGIVTTATRAVGINNDTHYEWLKKDPAYKKACNLMLQVALDFAESCLHKQIQKGNPLSTIFFLKCKGKKRGYIEQNIVEIKGNMKFKADFGTGNTLLPASEPTDYTQLD